MIATPNSTQVSVTIDGRPVVVPVGTLVADAAKMAGVDIPVFCHHPKLEPVGMCRMCLVEIGRPVRDRATGQVILENGQPKIQFLPKLETACTNRVEEGMVVLTQSEKALAGQKGTVEFLLTSHPLDCPVCDKGGECPLQNLTMAHGPGKSRFLYDEKLHLAKQTPLGDLIFLDQERCIQCGRCVRFQDEIAGDAVLGFDQRGRKMQIFTASEPGFDSVFSGNTTDICPVGALTTADFRFQARAWELDATPSLCGQCPVGCNLTVNTRREAQAKGRTVIKRLMPRQNEHVNEIWLCDKGRFAHQYVESGQRLLRPIVRKDGRGGRTSWETAAKAAAAGFAAAKKKFVVLASGRLANEDLFNLKSLADHLHGDAVLYSEMAGEATRLAGVGPGTNIGEMGAGTAIMVVASDLYEEAPIWYLRIKQAAARGARLIVANPRQTKLDRFADYTIRYAYGDEVKTIRTLGKKNKISEAFAKADNAVIFYGSEGLGVDGSAALAAACTRLLDDTDHLGRPNNGLVGVWQRANDQGAWELGFRAEADLPKLLRGKAVYVVGADPAGDDPKLAKALQAAKFVVVQDILESATARLADVVLPAQAHMERDGTFTSGERRVQRFHAAVPAVGEARPDFSITAQIARNAGFIQEGTSVQAAFDILSEIIPSFAGLSYEQLAEVPAQWPIVGRDDLYYGGTTYDNRHGIGVHLTSGKERGESIRLGRFTKEAGRRPRENELLAVPVTRLYDRGRTVLPAPLLNPRIGRPTVGLHPAAAQRLGIRAGERVKIKLDGQSADVVVQVDETISTGVVTVPRSMGIAIHAPVPAKVK